MHVGVGAVVVGKDKAARVGREEEEEGKKKVHRRPISQFWIAL